jgi:hypothetical protein
MAVIGIPVSDWYRAMLLYPAAGCATCQARHTNQQCLPRAHRHPLDHRLRNIHGSTDSRLDDQPKQRTKSRPNSPARPRIGGVTSRWPPTSNRRLKAPRGVLTTVCLTATAVHVILGVRPSGTHVDAAQRAHDLGQQCTVHGWTTPSSDCSIYSRTYDRGNGIIGRTSSVMRRPMVTRTETPPATNRGCFVPRAVLVSVTVVMPGVLVLIGRLLYDGCLGG